jgi:carbon starvation protein CstA
MLKELNAHDLLINMDQMEKSGTSFKNIKNNDISPIRYVGAVVASIVMTIFMAIIFFIMLWAFQTKPEESPPLPLIIVLMAIPVVIIIGVVFSLIQRISEIKKGETDDAKKF